MRRFAPLALLVAAYLVVASLYAIYTPDWQAPDEPAHYNYIAQLADGNFPIIEPGDYDQTYQSTVISSQFAPQYSVASFEYEDYQPPLYYLLQTPVFWLADGRLEALRLTSVLLGAGIVLLAYFIALRLFQARTWLALTAAAFVAFLPQHVAMVAAVNNDSLAELLIAAILLVLLAMVSPEQQNGGQARFHQGERRRYLILGVLLGLGFLTKVTVYIMTPLVGLVLAWQLRRDWRDLVRAGLLVFGLALAIGLSWWVRNLAVYGGLDFLGTAAHNAVVVGQPRTAEWIADRGLGGTVRAFAQTTFQSFWGQFGWMGVVMPAWVYRPLLIFSILTFLGFIWAAVRALALRSFTRSGDVFKDKAGSEADYQLGRETAVLALGGTFVLSLVVYLVYNLTFVQHQGRYLFPALVPIAIAVAIGWGMLAAPAIRRRPTAAYLVPAGLAILLLGLDLLALFRFIVPALT